MAYPALGTRELILEKALALIERDGTVSLHRLAHVLGIKAPSLYRYFPSRERLLAAAGLAGFRRLAQYIRSSTRKDPSLQAACWAIRRFAKKHPKLYRLMNESDARYEDPGEARDVVREVLTASFGSTLDDDALVAFRQAVNGVRAFVHGFVMLELAGQYQKTRELDESFAAGLGALLAAFENGAPGKVKASRPHALAPDAGDKHPVR